MSEVSSVTGSSSTTSTTSSTSSLADMDAFLTLFTAELQYQDPTNPMESYELASQLAQFSTVELLTEANDNLVEMESYLLSINNNLMLQMLGKEITGSSDTLQLVDGEVTDASYELESTADVTVKIYDSDGDLVRTMSLGSQEAGTYDIDWDGCDDSGEQLEDGLYTFEVEAVDANGNDVSTLATVTGTCVAVQMENGLVYLALDSADGVRITPSAVLEVREAEEAA